MLTFPKSMGFHSPTCTQGLEGSWTRLLRARESANFCGRFKQAQNSGQNRMGFLDTPIDQIVWADNSALNTRIVNCLLNNVEYHYQQETLRPVRTLRELIKLTDFDLIRMPNVGRKSVSRIKMRLFEMGLHLDSGHFPEPDAVPWIGA